MMWTYRVFRDSQERYSISRIPILLLAKHSQICLTIDIRGGKTIELILQQKSGCEILTTCTRFKSNPFINFAQLNLKRQRSQSQHIIG